MKEMKKPKHLQRGDTIAAVSLSWGGAGDEHIRWRYELAKKRMEEKFGLHVVEMPHTLDGDSTLRKHPQYRAQDLNEAFADPDIKGIISCTGGDDSIRLLPYIDFDTISENPKAFIGYSDSTVTHFICWRAGIQSIYGPSLLGEMAEPAEDSIYTDEWFEKALFHPEALGVIPVSKTWTSEHLDWATGNPDQRKKFQSNGDYTLLQGHGKKVRGHLMGGCLEIIDLLRGTALWPEWEDFDDSILFLETSEMKPAPDQVGLWLRGLAASHELTQVLGIVWGKPCEGAFEQEYQQIIREVLYEEYHFDDVPVLFGASFGHNQPMCCLPYGALAEIDADKKSFTILEGAVY